MKTVTVCIAGGRDFLDPEHMHQCMDAIKAVYYDHAIEIISGGARGADTLAEQWARDNELVFDEVLPDYIPGNDAHNRRAPLARNEEMGERADVLVAFWDGHSTGTRHMIGVAMRRKLEIHVFRYERAGSTNPAGAGEA